MASLCPLVLAYGLVTRRNHPRFFRSSGCEPVLEAQLVRFGLLCQVYDWLAEKGEEYKVPILVPDFRYGPVLAKTGKSLWYYQSSYVGLNQPAAGRGFVCPGINRLFGAHDPSMTTVRWLGMGYVG